MAWIGQRVAIKNSILRGWIAAPEKKGLVKVKLDPWSKELVLYRNKHRSIHSKHWNINIDNSIHVFAQDIILLEK